MVVKSVLVFFFAVYAIADGRIIKCNTDENHTSSILDLEPQMSDVRTQLVNITSQINAFIERVNNCLEPVEGKAPVTTTTCSDGSITYKGSCYYFDSEKSDFQTAENICSQQQAHLVHLETKEENKFLKGVMSKYYMDKLFWIGMTDSETEGVWKMTGTNTTIPFTDWYGTEPSDSPNNPTGQDCAAFFSSASYRWVDINCFDPSARAVCEKKM